MLFSKIPAYLIDSENVGSTWIDLLRRDDKADFYIFVTENAKSLNFSLLKELTENHRHKINIIECEPGKNSLDFYLASYLGYLVGSNRNSSYIVVSQDNGYDHVIEYWNKIGFEVTKVNTKPETIKKQPKARNKKSEPKAKENVNSETRVIVKKEPDAVKSNKKPEVKKQASTNTDKALLKKLMKNLGEEDYTETARLLDGIPDNKRSDKSFIYRSLVRKFKSEKGLEIYTLIKKDIDKYYRQPKKKASNNQ